VQRQSSDGLIHVGEAFLHRSF